MFKSSLSLGAKELAPAAVCAVVNVAILVGTLIWNPGYLTDYRRSINPDALHYVLEGRNTLLNGSFSRCSQPPYVADMLRTPVYPLFAGLLDIIGGPIAIYVSQCVFHVASCALMYQLASRVFTKSAGWFAALLTGTDLMMATSNFEAMSESLFTFLTLAAILIVVPHDVQNGSLPSPARCGASGFLLSIATLTRPAGLYLPLAIVPSFVAVALWRRRWNWGFRASATILFTFAVPVMAWVIRNAVEFGVPRLTTADAIMKVYFAGGGAYQVQHDITLEEAQSRISREYDLPPPQVTNNAWISDLSVKEIDGRLRTAQSKVLRKYPLSLVQSSVIGILKSHISHNISTLGFVWNIPWSATGGAENQIGTRLSRILDNHPILLAALAWQLLHTLLSWTLFMFGFVYLVRCNHSWAVAIVLAVFAYFLLTVALVGKEAYWRSRTPHMPYVYVIAGVGADLLQRRLKGILYRESPRLSQILSR